MSGHIPHSPIYRRSEGYDPSQQDGQAQLAPEGGMMESEALLRQRLATEIGQGMAPEIALQQWVRMRGLQEARKCSRSRNSTTSSSTTRSSNSNSNSSKPCHLHLPHKLFSATSRPRHQYRCNTPPLRSLQHSQQRRRKLYRRSRRHKLRRHSRHLPKPPLLSPPLEGLLAQKVCMLTSMPAALC
jgi:hypothetical protein